MSDQEEPEKPRAASGGPSDAKDQKGPKDQKNAKGAKGSGDPKQAETTADDTAQGGGTGDDEEHDQPQTAWAARRDLIDHSPRSMHVGDRSRFGGGLVGHDQHGVSGGRVTGDVIMGSKTEIHYAIPGLSAPASASGEVPRIVLERLAETFVADEEYMAGLLERLRSDRVLVLSGARFTGRHTAALMLLHRLGADPVRTLVRDTDPASLAKEFNSEDQARGYLVSDLATRRDRPLREPHLLAAKDRLVEQDAYLVITVGPTAVLENDVPKVQWLPPSAAQVLAAHVRTRTDEETAAKLLDLPDVVEFLTGDHQLREVVAFAGELGRFVAGEITEDAIAQFSLISLESQVQEWFEEDESAIHLRDKAFLVALAAFDGGPYALTAELSDLLYRFLQETENPTRVPEVPVFGTHIGKRLQLARATRYEEDEHTEWGPVAQQKARFLDERASLVLLRELWTGHPSARPALINWLRRLADDGRPLVRTRAASTVAILARTDLPSAMALVIEVWATSKLFRHRLVAVNSLTLAHLIDTPNIPRILDDWCEGDDERRRWVGVRSYGLIGSERPEQALAALRKAVRRLYENDQDLDLEIGRELAEAVGLLLLSSAEERVLAELRQHLDDDRAVRDLTLAGFVNACGRTEGDERYGMPLVLDWYARAVAAGSASANGIPYLWRAALADLRTTRPALDVLKAWVLIADRATATEWALAALLPALVATPEDHQRLSHLLRTMSGEDGKPPPQVAARLLTTLPIR
ncbi:hypothetical protein SAMN05216489_04359 [Streptomyces sp. 3213]|uniref:hypothetical protein n=1 Tax=Streptomyces sp. 3213.3 TaxID=1855348 RepID=UPI00089938B6|nr:hypothetical protein [Streptomyces sp. 3213.3]SED76125.1 hypothetical protein SAMN05216489_04359 [Streptomyces sp. 3213] [Streptomyces sp. 3213.3]